MIKNYLEERKNILNNIIRENKEKYEHNQIAVVESNNKIKDLDHTIDEASQIFSVKAREDNGFKNQEISELEERITAYVIENKEYKKNIDKAEAELFIVEKCLEEVEEKRKKEESNKENVSRETYETKEKIKRETKDENINVSRETLIVEKEKNITLGHQLDFNDMLDRLETKIDKKEIINKLEFCKSIAEMDSKRVVLELDNIIASMKN